MSDFIAGAAVGVSQMAIGHPFDTATVLIQNRLKWKGLPLKSYYRGWKFPLVSATMFNCTVFPIYERTIKYTNSYWLSGFLGGFAVTPFVFAFDVGKIKQQTQKPLTLNTVFTNYGKISTFARETIAMSVYFGTYFTCREREYHPLLSGAAAGIVNWTCTYPIDVIRSRQISQNISIPQAIKQGNLWKGYPICATRAIIVNAVNFWVYESVRKYL